MDVSTRVALCLFTMVWITRINGDIIVKDLTTNHTIKSFSDMQANFGPNFPDDGLEGWIVYADPDPEACGPVNSPPVNETWCHKYTCNFILLVARGGNCEFSDKVLAAQYAGYHAVIVHNSPGNNSEVEMQFCANDSQVKIPSTFVGYNDGMQLWGYNYTLQRYIITIIEDEEDLKLFLWPFAVVVGVCFFIFLVFMLVKILKDHASKKVNRLSKKHLKKIPVRKFKKGDYYDTCAICLDEYEEGEKIRVLPCDHVYHMKCIDPWLTKNKKTCPVCKRRVIPGRDADSESDSETENGQPTTGGSENTPLLSGGSGQSHGSIADSTLRVAPSDPNAQGVSQGNTSEDTSNIPPDTETGAVGGEGISDRLQTLQSSTTPHRGNIQEREERGDSHTERKRKKNWTRLAEDEDKEASRLLGDETRAERKERRKQKKEKKRKAEGRSRHQESGGGTQENDESKNIAKVNVIKEEGLSVTQTVDVSVKTMDDECGYVNPNYLDSHEVVVPTFPSRREMNDIV